MKNIKIKLRRGLVALALVAGVLSVAPVTPVSATVTTGITATTCYTSGGMTSAPRVCADSSVPGLSGQLFVFANGGDTWTARSYIGNRSEYINPGWSATGGDRWNGADNSFTANGSLFLAFPPSNYIGPVRFCNYYDGYPTCWNDGSTILATGNYAASTIAAAKAAITAGVPVYLI